MDETVYSTSTLIMRSWFCPMKNTQLQELTNDKGAFRRFFRFPSSSCDRSDFRLREFKMAATGKSLIYIQTVSQHFDGGGGRFCCYP